MPISYTFAAEDLDNDGVEDSMDLCPNLQEDYEGAVDGCPSDFVPWQNWWLKEKNWSMDIIEIQETINKD